MRRWSKTDEKERQSNFQMESYGAITRPLLQSPYHCKEMPCPLVGYLPVTTGDNA